MCVRVCVWFARVLRSEERKCVVRFGGLVIHNIGQLLPVQIHSGCFNTSEYVYPVCVCGWQLFLQCCDVFITVTISFSVVILPKKHLLAIMCNSCGAMKNVILFAVFKHNFVICLRCVICCFPCFDTVGWASGRASGLLKIEWWDAGMVICLEQGANDLCMV